MGRKLEWGDETRKGWLDEGVDGGRLARLEKREENNEEG
jgi:hypothetical protein